MKVVVAYVVLLVWLGCRKCLVHPQRNHLYEPFCLGKYRNEMKTLCCRVQVTDITIVKGLRVKQLTSYLYTFQNSQRLDVEYHVVALVEDYKT